MEERYKVKKINNNGAYAVFDTKRNVTVMQSVSPRAKYNEQVCKNVVYALNLCKLPDASDEQN
jgi:hypothetical protein